MSATNTQPVRHKNFPSAIVAQKGAKVNISELIENLKAQLQELEDAKQQIAEAQEDLRETIAELQMAEVKTI